MHYASRRGDARSCTIQRAGKAAALAFVAAFVCCAVVPAKAQVHPELRNDQISIEYYEPRDPRMLPLYQKLPQRGVLERLSEFLAPVRWPKKLRLIMKECPSNTPMPQVFYSKIEYSLTVCYQWFWHLSSLRPRPAFATRQEVIVGGLVGIVLHEAALAVFDMRSVPVLGSESDAADQAAAFVALQFNDDVARTVIKGTYFVWKTYDDWLLAHNVQYDFAGRSSVPRQRMYNTLCIASGGAPAIFKNFVDQGELLPVGRAESCEQEYLQAQFAFTSTIAAGVDKDMMKKVQSLTWIGADDLK